MNYDGGYAGFVYEFQISIDIAHCVASYHWHYSQEHIAEAVCICHHCTLCCGGSAVPLILYVKLFSQSLLQLLKHCTPLPSKPHSNSFSQKKLSEEELPQQIYTSRDQLQKILTYWDLPNAALELIYLQLLLALWWWLPLLFSLWCDMIISSNQASVCVVWRTFPASGKWRS